MNTLAINGQFRASYWAQTCHFACGTTPNLVLCGVQSFDYKHSTFSNSLMCSSQLDSLLIKQKLGKMCVTNYNLSSTQGKLFQAEFSRVTELPCSSFALDVFLVSFGCIQMIFDTTDTLLGHFHSQILVFCSCILNVLYVSFAL